MEVEPETVNSFTLGSSDGQCCQVVATGLHAVIISMVNAGFNRFKCSGDFLQKPQVQK